MIRRPGRDIQLQRVSPFADNLISAIVFNSYGCSSVWDHCRKYSGTLYNDPEWREGLYFDGSNDYLDFGNFTGLAVDNVTLIIKLKCTNSNGWIYSRVDWNTSGWSLKCETDFELSVHRSGANQDIDSFIEPDNTWMTIAVSIDNSSLDVEWYKNGRSSYSTSMAAAFVKDTTSNLHIGKYNESGGSYKAIEIEYIYVFNEVLPPALIFELYKNPYVIWEKPFGFPYMFAEAAAGGASIPVIVKHLREQRMA
ncbi:MAG: LamG-like jellyroll fold domain-containing protein [Pseudomonadota bacterium]|nr:LamG-like jellyroll fold domain-containing protein [Pseudomonadota bacterium]